MPRVRRCMLLAVVAVLLVPNAQAAVNGSRTYGANYGYMPGLAGSTFTMASGALQATAAKADGSFGFFNTTGAQVSGLTRVCWTAGVRQCADSTAGTLSVRILKGGSFGLRVPGTVQAQVAANHSLAMFTDLSQAGDLNGLGVGRSLLAPLVGGVVTLSNIAPIPKGTLSPTNSDGAGVLSATDKPTVLEIRDGATLKATLRDKSDPVTFAGKPAITAVSCEMTIVPFQGTTATSHFTPAGRAAANQGLDLVRINALMRRFFDASQSGSTQAQPIDPNAFGAYRDAAAGLFGGAVLNLPNGNSSQARASFGFARITQLEVKGTASNGLTWTGKATLEIKNGHVAGARHLYGFSFVQLPWWSWLLWFLGIAAWITRLAVKPEKHHPTWDRLRWIGWVVSPLVFLLVLFLWDLEVKAVVGLSVLSGTLHGQLLLLVALFELSTFAGISFAAIAPLRLLVRSGSLLLRQGTFMGLSGAVASLIGFVLGATYLRAYLDVLVSQVMRQLG